MEKLSHIVKSSTQSHVDLSKERPVRAGAASFGQPVSKTNHVYEAPESAERPQAHSAFSAVQEQVPAAERQKEIVDRVNFSFKKAELPVVQDNEESTEEKTQELSHAPVSMTPTMMSENPEADKARNVNLSIYV